MYNERDLTETDRLRLKNHSEMNVTLSVKLRMSVSRVYATVCRVYAFVYIILTLHKAYAYDVHMKGALCLLSKNEHKLHYVLHKALCMS